jgi:hypothetical protein
MMALRFFTDEDMHGPIAPALRNVGIDAVSTPEVNRLGEPDEAQLKWSTSEGRVLVTFNIGDFLALHTSWLGAGVSHSGIVVSAQRPIGDVLRRLLHLAATLDAEAMRDRLEFLSDW